MAKVAQSLGWDLKKEEVGEYEAPTAAAALWNLAIPGLRVHVGRAEPNHDWDHRRTSLEGTHCARARKDRRVHAEDQKQRGLRGDCF